MQIRRFLIAVLALALPQALLAADTPPARGNLPQAERWLTGHNNAICAIAFSPDGKLLASAGAETELRIWDVATGKCLKILAGHRNVILAVAFSRDGKKVATGAADNTAKIWNVATGALEANLVDDHIFHIHAVAFSANAAQLVTGSCDGTVRTWDLATEKQLLRLDRDGIIVTIDWSHDGKYLLIPGVGAQAAGQPGSIAVDVVDATTGTSVRQGLGTGSFLSRLQSFDHGNKCFHIFNGGPATAYDVRTGKQLWRYQRRGNNEFLGGISDDGSRFFEITNSSLRVLDAKDQSEALTLRHTGYNVPSALSPDGKLLAVGGAGTHGGGMIFEHAYTPGDDHAIRLYDLDLMKREILAALPEREPCLTAKPKENLVTAYGGEPYLIDVAAQMLAGSPANLTLSRDRTRIAWNLPERIGFFDAAGRQTSSMPSPARNIGALAFSTDAKQILCGPGHEPGPLLVVDLENPRITARLGPVDAAAAIACSPDGQRVAAIGGKPHNGRTYREGSTELFVWELATGKQIAHYAEPIQTAPPYRQWLALSPDARFAIAGTVERVIQFDQAKCPVLHDVTLFDVETGNTLRPLTPDGIVKAGPVFAADGKHVLFCDSDWHLTVASIIDPNDTWRGPQRRGRQFALSADGQSIFVGCDDGTLRTYRMSK